MQCGKQKKYQLPANYNRGILWILSIAEIKHSDFFPFFRPAAQTPPAFPPFMLRQNLSKGKKFRNTVPRKK